MLHLVEVGGHLALVEPNYIHGFGASQYCVVGERGNGAMVAESCEFSVEKESMLVLRWHIGGGIAAMSYFKQQTLIIGVVKVFDAFGIAVLYFELLKHLIFGLIECPQSRLNSEKSVAHLHNASNGGFGRLGFPC